MRVQQRSHVVDAWVVDRDHDVGSVVGRFEQYIRVTGLVERTPAGEVVAGELSSHLIDSEVELICVQGAAEPLDALGAVAVNDEAEWIAPSRWAGDHDRVCGLAPTLAATELHALWHSRIMSG